MNKRGFTLVELLVVVAIMGLLGTASVGGYRQMQRGMEERGVVETVQKFVDLAAERSLIDRRPTAIYFWNELLREETDDEPEIVAGRAVAVCMKGRISKVAGSCLIDEFGDLEQIDEEGAYKDADNTEKMTMRLYCMDNLQNGLRYSTVRVTPRTNTGDADGGQTEIYLQTDPVSGNYGASVSSMSGGSDKGDKGKIIQCGYYKDGKSTANWGVGSAYGMEFQRIELPHGYIFGKDWSSLTTSNPTTDGETMAFGAATGASGNNDGGNVSGTSTIILYALRPNSSGKLQAYAIGGSGIKATNVQLNN